MKKKLNKFILLFLTSLVCVASVLPLISCAANSNDHLTKRTEEVLEKSMDSIKEKLHLSNEERIEEQFKEAVDNIFEWRYFN